MARYWTPTRAAHFDHVSRARIAEIVSNAVSPTVAADLAKMKKADTAAAAELRLAKVTWLPKILTDREMPAAPSWAIRQDDDAEDIEVDDEIDEPTENDRNRISHRPHDVEASTATAEQPPWPFPTTESVSASRTDPDAA